MREEKEIRKELKKLKAEHLRRIRQPGSYCTSELVATIGTLEWVLADKQREIWLFIYYFLEWILRSRFDKVHPVTGSSQRREGMREEKEIREALKRLKTEHLRRMREQGSRSSLWLVAMIGALEWVLGDKKRLPDFV